ncbi:MAG: hypothetical protein H6737_17585 [Alphaproteobacteria bacterium]|nr:hypothetical protein [Alphaproteobacteria bacterium]
MALRCPVCGASASDDTNPWTCAGCGALADSRGRLRAQTEPAVDHVAFTVADSGPARLALAALVAVPVAFFVGTCAVQTVLVLLVVATDVQFLPVATSCMVAASPVFTMAGVLASSLPLPTTEVRVYAKRVEIAGTRVPFESITRCERTDGTLTLDAARRHALPDPDGRVYDALVAAIAAFDTDQAKAPDAASDRARLARLREG